MLISKGKAFYVENENATSTALALKVQNMW